MLNIPDATYQFPAIVPTALIEPAAGHNAIKQSLLRKGAQAHRLVHLIHRQLSWNNKFEKIAPLPESFSKLIEVYERRALNAAKKYETLKIQHRNMSAKASASISKAPETPDEWYAFFKQKTASMYSKCKVLQRMLKTASSKNILLPDSKLKQCLTHTVSEAKYYRTITELQLFSRQ